MMNIPNNHSKLSNTLLKAIGIAVSASTIVTNAYAGTNDAEAENELKVYIDDVRGQATTGWDNARDDLLQNAFYEASERTPWVESFDLEYNTSPDESERHYIVFTVVDWERSPANFYEFRSNAHYVNADGERIDLGSFTGIRSGITVTTSRDIGDHYSAAAEDAFSDALEKLSRDIEQS